MQLRGIKLAGITNHLHDPQVSSKAGSTKYSIMTSFYNYTYLSCESILEK